MNKASYVNFCTKPWEELVVYPNGEYSICCGGPPIGKITSKEQIKDIWNSEKVICYRKNLLSGIEDGICKQCVFHSVLRNSNQNDFVTRNNAQYPMLSPHVPVISFGLTDQCNLSCFMCGIAKRFEGKSNRIATADRLPIEWCEEFAIHHFRHANILNTNCFGELFLYPNLMDFLKLIKDNRPRFVTSTTSGSLKIFEETWDLVLGSHDEIIFSLDSFNPDLHKVIRGFDIARFYENLEVVKRLKNDKYPNFQFGVSMVIMKINVHEMADFTRRAVEELGVSSVNFQHVSGYPSMSVSDEAQWRVIYNQQLKQVNAYRAAHPFKTNGNLGFFLDENGIIEGDDGAKLYVPSTTVVEQVSAPVPELAKQESNIPSCNRVQSSLPFGGKFDFTFAQFAADDAGPVLYILDEHDDSIMAFIKQGPKLLLNVHSGTDTWTLYDLETAAVESLRIGFDEQRILVNGIPLAEKVAVSAYEHNLLKSRTVASMCDKLKHVEPFVSCMRGKLKNAGGKLIGAFYYGWYVENDWKEMCKRYVSYAGKPVLGWYNSIDESVVGEHIDMAKRAGIDFFIVSYDGSDLSKFVLESLLSIAARKDFGISIQYELCNLYGDPVRVTSKFTHEIETNFKLLSRKMMKSKAWQKIDGKPCVFVYGSRRVLTKLDEIDLIRSCCKKNDTEVFVFGDEIWWHDVEVNLDKAARLGKFDGLYAYNLYIPDGYCSNKKYAGKEYLRFIAPVHEKFSALARQNEQELAPTIMPRYCDSAVRQKEGHYPIPPENGKFYRDYFNFAKNCFVGRNKILLITSFNEWYEDTQIEPYETLADSDEYDLSPSYGNMFLDLTCQFKKEM